MFEHYSVADLFPTLTKTQNPTLSPPPLLSPPLQLKQLGIKTLSKTQQVIQLILAIKSLLQKTQPKRF